jgi:hypothetical protein
MDAGDGDGEWLQFDAQAFGEAELGGFRGGIGAEIGQSAPSAGTGDDHELAAETVARLLAFHGGDGLAAALDRAEQIGVEDVPDVFFAHRVEGAGKAIAGVADDGVEPTEFFEGGGDDTVAIFRARDIGGDTIMLAAEIAGEFLETVQTPGRQDQAAAATGQISRQSPADPGTGSRDDCDHVLQASTHSFDCNLYIRFCGFSIFFMCTATEDT